MEGIGFPGSGVTGTAALEQQDGEQLGLFTMAHGDLKVLQESAC